MEEKWCYRGEGNASIVAACVKENIVYRIRKVDGDKTKVGSHLISTKAAFSGLEFVQNVMKDFISPQFLVPMKIVKVPDGLLKLIHTSWRLLRPEFRLCKDVSCGDVEAIEMPDLCFIFPNVANQPQKPAYSFEIKPKWGLLPMADRVSEVKRSNCRFCMHQFLKLKQRKWSKKSSYCPIDLFSGCQTRMDHALNNLYLCPQNNFCIFKNGQRLWNNISTGEKQSSDECLYNEMNNELMDELLDVVKQCLLYPSTDHMSQGTSLHHHQICRSSSCEHFCDKGCHSLPAGSVLSNLLNAQSLDDLDVEDLHLHYKNVSEFFCKHSEHRKLSYLDGPYTYSWCEAPSADSFDSGVALDICKVKRYLISRSAKDCSIFITVQEVNSDLLLELPPRTFFLTSASGTKYLCCVSVIDLDPKSFEKIPTYVEEEKNVVDCFQESC